MHYTYKINICPFKDAFWTTEARGKPPDIVNLQPSGHLVSPGDSALLVALWSMLMCWIFRRSQS